MSDDGCGCNPLDEVEIYYQIKEAKSKAEQLIMLVHGGHETYEFPSPRMKKLYRWFIDLGADAVVGHHTHCYSGREVYKGKPIIYSLGNFIFDHAKWHDNFWTRGCACVLEIDSNDLNATIVPFHQCEKEVGIRLFYDAEYATFKRHDAQKTDVIKDDVLLSVNFDVFVAKQKKMFDAMLEPKPNKIYLLLRKLGVPFSLLSKSKRRLYLNLIRCESHRDILFGTLKSTIK
jgi:poly-gamma-glutamate synthesis protein (capsule biosynthesis protein)